MVKEQNKLIIQSTLLNNNKQKKNYSNLLEQNQLTYINHKIQINIK